MHEKLHPELSPREKQLLKYAAEGLTDTAISLKLGISEATISTYWGRIRMKLGPYSRTELVATMLKEQNEKVLDSLRAENERLVQKLRLETGEGNDGSNFYKSLLEMAADAIFVVDQDGLIQNLNDFAAEMFGYAKEELVGGPVTRLMPERYRDGHGTHRANYLSAPTKRRMGEHRSTVALKKSGEEFMISASLSAIEVENGFNILCIVREVTSA